MLLNCTAYQEGRKLAEITVPEISDYLARQDCFVWVAQRDASPAELEEMKQEFGLHDLAVEDAQHGHQRPKIEEYGDSLFAVLHMIDFDAEDMLHIGEVDIFVGPNYLLSVRSRSQQSLHGVRLRCEREPHLLTRGAGFVLYALMDAVVDLYFPIMQRLDAKLEAIEAKIFSKQQSRSNVEELYDLKQNVMTLRHAITPLMDAVGRLGSGRPPRICEGMQDYFRDVLDHLTRLNTSIESMRESITTAIQVNLAMVAIEESEVSKRLAAWAGIFAAATAFAGIWGMNFEMMPELRWKYGYPFALGMIGLTCYLLYRRFKRAGWL